MILMSIVNDTLLKKKKLGRFFRHRIKKAGDGDAVEPSERAKQIVTYESSVFGAIYRHSLDADFISYFSAREVFRFPQPLQCGVVIVGRVHGEGL